jgi:hypothetical protein
LPRSCGPASGGRRGLLDPEPVVLADVPLVIDPAEVRAFQDYKPPLPLSAPEAAARLEAARREVGALIEPRLAYRAVAVATAEADRLVLATGARLRIPGVDRHWGHVEAIVAAVATIGDAAEREVAARRTAGEALAATLLDTAASAAVECLAEWGNDHFCRLGVAARLRVTNRISPGLAGWDLGEQAVLLGLCPAADIGVRLESGERLHPAKSISFLVGVGPAARVDHYFVQCRRCWATDCAWRRAPPVASVHRHDATDPRDH